MSAQEDELHDDEGDFSSASDVCCCGPHYDEETAKKNQLLRVPRVTTDQPSLLLLFGFVLFMSLVWLYAIDKGQYKILLNGMDWRGQACGSGDLATYKYQAWTNPLMHNIKAGAICVRDCPAPPNDAEINKNELVCICNKDYWPSKFTAAHTDLVGGCNTPEAATLGYFKKEVNDGDALLTEASTGATGGADQPCAFPYRTKWAMHRCVPWVSSAALKTVVTQEQTSGAESHDYIADWLGTSTEIFATFMSDVAASVYVLGACIGCSVVLAIISIFALKNSVEFVAKTFLLALLGLLASISVVSYMEFDTYRKNVHQEPPVATHDQDEQSMYVYLGVCIVTAVLSVLHLGFIVFMHKEMDKAVSIIQVAAQTFIDAPQIMLYPLVHMFSFVCLVVFWLAGAILLYSAGDVKTAADGVAYMEHTPGIRSSAVGYLYGLFWMSGFMNAMGYMIVAGTVYLCTFAQPRNRGTLEEPDYNEDDKDVPESVMTAAAVIIIRYHMGTAAFGSLVFSLVWPLRIITNLFGKLGNSETPFLKFCCCCCRCCFNSWETCFKFICKMAYLQTVLHGFSFCGACYEGLVCVMKGIDDVGPTTFISTSILMVIKLTISLFVTGLANVLISSGQFSVTPNDLTYSWVPYLLVFFSTFIICTAFMLILEVAIDAVMVAFCEAKYEEKGAIKEHQLPMALREHLKKFGSGAETQPLLSAGTKNTTG